MQSAEKEATVIQLCKSYKLSLLALSEVRWINSPVEGNEKKIDNFTVLWSGHDRRHQHGVALVMCPQTRKALRSWEPIDDRLLLARFQTNFGFVSVVSTYGPTDVSSVNVKDAFYTKLADVIASIPRKDAVILAGDLNARVGSDSSFGPGAMGAFGFGVINDNGLRLLDVALSQELVVGGTLFDHKEIHKYTWTHPNGFRSQQDHILISKSHRNWLYDVRTFRGADVYTDHELVVSKIHFKMKSFKSGSS